jgi:CheY-like chemotaxis protein
MGFVVAAFRRTDVQRMVRSALERDGHTVVLFKAGRPAIAEVVAGAPDLVVIEAQLLDMGAVEMCRTLRLHDPTIAVPIVICGPLRRSDRELIAAHPGPVRRAQLLPSDLRTTVAAALDASFETERVADQRRIVAA